MSVSSSEIQTRSLLGNVIFLRWKTSPWDNFFVTLGNQNKAAGPLVNIRPSGRREEQKISELKFKG